MTSLHHFTSVHFKNFKAFKDYWVSLNEFNVLVGPNNSGKSTILGAFRILSEGMRKAKSKRPTIVEGPEHETFGYHISLDEVPIATENIFTDYDDTNPAQVKFRLSNGNELLLFFPSRGVCYLICKTKSAEIRTTTQFKKEFNATIGFVPVLGPVEHNELLYQREAARLALLTHRASRNFRNIWYHYPENFEKFRDLLRSTWPGMDIELPEIDLSRKKPRLHMFCPEGRIPREIFWAGFGFQVWCQMLTFIVSSSESSLFIIDEPDIYLHSDLQRQLVSVLKNLGPDILIATHSIEIISESDPDDLLVINKSYRSAKRIKDPTQLQKVFQILGSNLNPILTQLAKNKRALFVEGKDFQILSKFARKLNKNQVANRSDFTVIPVEGFNPEKVKDFSKGIALTLGTQIITGIVFDRDYRSDSEVNVLQADLKKTNKLAHIHQRKEIENYLFESHAIEKAINKKLSDRKKRIGDAIEFEEQVDNLLEKITSPLRHKTEAQYISKRLSFEKSVHPNLDDSTITEKMMMEFEEQWEKIENRLCIVPGKQVFSSLNKYLQENYKITLTFSQVIDGFSPENVPDEILGLIKSIDLFRLEVI
jgi:energy-coupling factor transporter ATP-binding protein EcfA2